MNKRRAADARQQRSHQGIEADQHQENMNNAKNKAHAEALKKRFFHTFSSASTSPNKPEGRKMRMMMSNAKAMTSFN